MNNTFCNKYDDEYGNTWPETNSGNVAEIPCSSYLNQNLFVDSTEMAFKECLANATWSLITNLTMCSAIESPQTNFTTTTTAINAASNISLASLHSSSPLTTSTLGPGNYTSRLAPSPSTTLNRKTIFYDTNIMIYYTGYSISMVSLILALIILTYFKSLRCMRNIIHCHLIIAFIMSDIMWISLHLVHMNYRIFSKSSLEISCNIVSLLYTYFFTANFFWMFAEGIYMYQMVVLCFTRKLLPLKWIAFIGWGIPCIIMIAWFCTNMIQHGSICLVHVGRHQSAFIYAIPIFIVLVINFIIFLLVVKLLIEKVFFSKAGGNINYMKSFKGFFFLIPHLGIIYILTMYAPKISITYNKILVPLLLSTQGFFVALYCCFMNKEVKLACTTEMKHMENRRKSSATTTSILFPSNNSDSILPSYLTKRFSVLSNAIKRPSLQSCDSTLLNYPMLLTSDSAGPYAIQNGGLTAKKCKLLFFTKKKPQSPHLSIHLRRGSEEVYLCNQIASSALSSSQDSSVDTQIYVETECPNAGTTLISPILERDESEALLLTKPNKVAFDIDSEKSLALTPNFAPTLIPKILNDDAISIEGLIIIDSSNNVERGTP